MADDFRDFVKFDGFAGQAWYHQMIRDKRILRRAREFTPERLFKSGEQGVWYDPSDTTTLFQDSAGTTPVTASGQPVGRMLDKSGRGNHATQPTADRRPIYRRGDSRGVVNLLTWSEDFGNAVWTKDKVTITPNAIIAPDGTLTADLFTETSATGEHIANPSVLTSQGVAYSSTCFMKKGSGRYGLLRFAPGASYANAIFDLQDGTLVSAGSGLTATITHVFDGWYRCTASGVRGAGGSFVWGLSDGSTHSYTGDGTSGIYIWGAQLNLGPTALPYQRNDATLGGVATGASTDLHWLETDGVDDGMATGNIDFTGTDKVSVFAGVRKLSDAATAFLVELGPDSNNKNGAFGMTAPSASGGISYRFQSRGTAFSPAGNSSFAPAPNSSVISGVASISGDSTKLCRNGALIEEVLVDQGTGNYGNYPLYLFRRGGTSLPFNGWFYGLAITGRLATNAETVATERYLAAKSAVVIP